MGREIEYKIERISIRFVEHALKPYENGRFVPLFQDAAYAISICRSLHETDLRLLFYIFSSLDEKNRFSISPTKVSQRLQTTRQSINRSVKKLVQMKIICSDESSDSYIFRLGDYVLNPVIAFWGDTRLVDKKNLPIPVDIDTGELMLPANSVEFLHDE